MRYISVLIHDLGIDQTASTVFTPTDIEFIDEKWEQGDEVLDKLQAHSVFAGYRRWCDLLPVHYRVMLALNMQRAADLTSEERGNTDNETIRSLNFLLMCFIRCLEESGDFHIDFLRIFRTETQDVHYTFEASVSKSMGALRRFTHPTPDTSPKTPGIRLFVDNDKDKDKDK